MRRRVRKELRHRTSHYRAKLEEQHINTLESSVWSTQHWLKHVRHFSQNNKLSLMSVILIIAQMNMVKYMFL